MPMICPVAPVNSTANAATAKWAASPTAAHFAVAAFAVEFTGATGQIIGIEANGVGRPGFGDAVHVVEHGATDAVALAVGRNGHGEEIEGSLALGEVFPVDRPRF